MKFSIIHPSRERPNMARETVYNWLKKAKSPDEIEYFISLDKNDPMINDYLAKFTNFVNTKVVINDNRSIVDAVNKAAAISKGEILIVVSDDFDCPENWDTEILRHSANKKDWLMKTLDGIQEWIVTLPIMDRYYYENFQYIYFPDYLHMFCDTELTTVADFTGKIIKAPVLFKHNHYVTGVNKNDDVYKKALDTWKQGETLYLKRWHKKFDLREEAIIGTINAASHLNWLLKKGIKI